MERTGKECSTMNSLFDDLKEGLQEAIDFEQQKNGNSLSTRVSAEIKKARDGDRTRDLRLGKATLHH